MIKRTLIVVGALAAMLALALPAYGQQYPPEQLFCTVSDTSPTPGQTVTVTAGTFAPGSAVSITFRSTPRFLGEDDDVDESGRVVRDITIPTDATLGTHTITASGTAPDGAPRSVSTTVEVVPAGAGAGGAGAGGAGAGAGAGGAGAGAGGAGVGAGAGETQAGAGAAGAQGGLPRTGDDSLPLVRIGVVTLAVGAGLVFVTRRRRAAAAS